MRDEVYGNGAEVTYTEHDAVFLLTEGWRRLDLPEIRRLARDLTEYAAGRMTADGD